MLHRRLHKAITSWLAASILLCMSSFVQANTPVSNCRVNIAYGPYVSLMFINRFFSQYHTSIEKKLDCQVNFDLFQEYDGFVQAILSDEYDITVLPKAYASSFIKHDYEAYAVIDRGVQAYVLSSKASSVDNISQLEGHKIAVLHPFAGSALLFKQALQQHVPLQNVQWVAIPSYEGIMIDVIERRVDAGVVIAPYYDIIAKGIRERKLKTLAKLPVSEAYLMIHQRKRSLAESLGKLILQSSELNWRKVNQQPVSLEPNSAIEAYVNRMMQAH